MHCSHTYVAVEGGVVGEELRVLNPQRAGVPVCIDKEKGAMVLVLVGEFRMMGKGSDSGPAERTWRDTA